MKLSKSYFYTLRENVKDEGSTSENLPVHAGMIKKSNDGIYMIMLMGKCVLKKIKEIVREEMDAAGAQGLLMPTMIPEEIYEKSGHREAFGSSMFALKGRCQKNYVLEPTHEELLTMAAMMKGSSYKDFLYNLYQVQTKFRDGTKPCHGLIRVREFVMKGAYSFDIDEAGLQGSYMKMFQAYRSIMDHRNLNYKIVKADTRAMSDSLPKEFQAVTEIGGNVVMTCGDCDFSGNLGITEVIDTGKPSDEEVLDMEAVGTPSAKTIEDITTFFQKSVDDFVKTLIYSAGGKAMASLLKGDRKLDETKVLKLLQTNEVELVSFDEVGRVTHARASPVGPVGLRCPIIMDHKATNMKNFIVGASGTDHHIKDVNLRDFTVETVTDTAQIHEGDICPKCGKPLKFCKGIEVGNTFKLGTKYAKALGLEYQDVNNKLHLVEMGCYGFGLERYMATIAEQHDNVSGIIWPAGVAPFKVVTVAVFSRDGGQMRIGNELYETPKKEDIDILLDDRKERPGVKFENMELVGIPYRITVDRGIKDGNVEFCARTTDESSDVSPHEIVGMVKKESQK